MQTRAPWRQWPHRIRHRPLSLGGRRTGDAAAPIQPTPRSPLRNESGAAAVELALVLPVALLLLMGVVQFGALLFLQNTMVNVANDVARRVSVGDLSPTAGAVLAEERLSGWNATFDVSVTEPTSNDVLVSISVPLADATVVDFGHFFDVGDLSAEATMRKE